MKVTIEIPYENVQRQNLQIGDGILVKKSIEPLNRFQGTITKLEFTEEEQAGGGFRAG